jgi:cytoplasmic iron level regulating protein YaaA (DUF328/UPF0246 family)
MIIVLSPAKSLDYETPAKRRKHTLPDFIPASTELIALLRRLGPAQLASLMKISDPLAQLNAGRYASWTPEFGMDNSKQAVLAFNGDVYDGLDAKTLSAADLDYTQRHLRILSGLYGLLRPLDLMQPYRLEMGTALANARGKDLYAFWGDGLTDALNELLGAGGRAVRAVRAGHGSPGKRVLLNCASQEYFKAVRVRRLEATVVTPVFEDWKSGRYKLISFYAKRARGLLARYAIVNRIDDPRQLAGFDSEDYRYIADASDETTYVFRRRVAGR